MTAWRLGLLAVDMYTWFGQGAIIQYTAKRLARGYLTPRKTVMSSGVVPSCMGHPSRRFWMGVGCRVTSPPVVMKGSYATDLQGTAPDGHA